MKEINKEQIVQLREHDLNRGHNKSQTPIYPKTIAAAVEGLDSIGGVTKVDSLPDTGEAGKIYYNNTDGKYYIYSNDEFTVFGNSDMPIGLPEEDDRNNTYTINPNTYYDLGTISGSGANQGDPAPKIKLRGYPRSDVALQYVGRFTAAVDAQPFSFEPEVIPENTIANVIGPHIPDEDTEIDIIADHTYEFNILGDIVILKDIKYTISGSR